MATQKPAQPARTAQAPTRPHTSSTPATRQTLGPGQPPRVATGPQTAPPRGDGPSTIRVRATETCYYDNERKRAGDVFDISGERIPLDETIPSLDRHGDPVYDADGNEKRKAHPRAGDVRDFNVKCMEYVDGRTPFKTTGSQAALNRELHRVEQEKAGSGPTQGGDEADPDVLSDSR